MVESLKIDFGINQRTVPTLRFSEFLELAADLGCAGVEARNDLGRAIFDGLSPRTAAKHVSDRGLRLLGLSEVYPFDDWTQRTRSAVRHLIDIAFEAKAETISLIPRVDGGGPADGDVESLYREIVYDIASWCPPEVVPLIEPIGFSHCSIRKQRTAARAIEGASAGGKIGILHDTFQHTLAADGDYLVDHIKLVHLSGASVSLPDLNDAHDSERGFVDENDRTSVIPQIRRLLNDGYDGAFSFEVTSAAVQTVGDPAQNLRRSMDYLVRALDSDDGH